MGQRPGKAKRITDSLGSWAISAARMQMQIQSGISGFALSVQHNTPLLASTERNLAPVRHRGYT
jgi:hypothetical protein